METISSYLAHDHRRCDEIFVRAEEAAAKGDWQAAGRDFAQLAAAVRHHFNMEERVMFPAFEQATGNTMGPTRMMRMEHEQMRELFDEMAQAVRARDAAGYAGIAETLLVLMQQHNLKEENVLYPMSDQVLGARQSEVIGGMAAVEEEVSV